MSDSVELQLFASLALAGVLALVLLFVWTRRIRSDKRHTSQLREREDRLKLALWASSEQYWDYDLKTRHIRRIWVDSRGNRSDLQVMSTSESDHRIHPDDLPQVEAKLRAHLRGEAELLISEHRILDAHGQWQ